MPCCTVAALVAGMNRHSPGRSICLCTCRAHAVPQGSSALPSSSETQSIEVKRHVTDLCGGIKRTEMHSPWTVQLEQSSSPGHWLR